MDGTKNKLIVIAEDSITQAEQLKYILEKEGFRVLHGLNGIEAFDIIKRERPLVIISDIMMPEMDGYELCKRVKANEELKEIPVILLTVLSDPTDVINGLECGADNFITKPYNEDYLISRVQNIITNFELRKDRYAEMGIDIYFNGKNYRITSRRLQILDLLLSTYENSIQKNIELGKANKELIATQKELEYLNKNLEKEVEERTQKITRLNTLLEAIRNINQLIVKEKEPRIMLQKACIDLVKVRNYQYAWIMILDEKGKVVYAIQEGIGNEFQTLEKDLKKGRWPVCCQKTMKQSEIVKTKDQKKECKGCPLVINRSGMGCLTVQLEYSGRIYGILVINLASESLTNEEEHNLLFEVAGDLSFALHDIKLEEEHRKANIELQKRTHDLNKRLKEIYCLYGIDEISTLPGITLSEVFNETIRLIQTSWQYPEITAAKITFEGKDYQSDNFKKTKWLLQTDLVLNKKKAGSIEVYYLEKNPDVFGGPFLEEEMHLLQRIVKQLGKFIIRLREEKELIVAKERAEKADRLKSSFLMNMSHEIRTPMNAIIGFSDLLLNPEISKKEQDKFVEVIQESGGRLLHLIDDILDISKMESGLLTISKVKCSVLKLLSEQVMNFNDLKIKMEKEKVEIRLDKNATRQDYTLITDPYRLKQILTNLIDNALKYTESGFIEIGYSILSAKHPEKKGKTGEALSFIRFYVKDTGIGIPEDHIDYIFDRFIKVEDKTKLYGGAGLGLTITKNLVNMMGGEIWVESVVNQGSTFYFTLPFEASDKEIKDIGLKDKIPVKFEWTDKVILIAEDEESNYSLLEHILKKTKVLLLWVKNGKEAVDMCRSNKNINLVLMDIKMPEMDGYTATRSIKKFRKNLPVVAITAYAAEGEKEESIKAGCSDYLAKPIKADELLPLIDKYIERGRKKDEGME
ncbi:MAG: response regulator [Bacteroidales bacterium]|nr:response regulator [Bacteroidales bacterium]